MISHYSCRFTGVKFLVLLIMRHGEVGKVEDRGGAVDHC